MLQKKIQQLAKTILIPVCLFTISGCISDTLNQMYGLVEVYQSNIDGSKIITMSPAIVETDGPLIYLSLYWSSKMPEDQLHLNVAVAGVHHFAQGESLHFKIDEQTVSFKSFDNSAKVNQAATDFGDTYQRSEKRYFVTKDFVKWLLSSSHALVEIDLTDNRAAGIFSTDGPGRARPAFRKFMDKVNQHKQ